MKLFNISKSNNTFLSKTYKSSMADLSSFFRIGQDKVNPNIILIPDRATFDLLQGRKSEDWGVGWQKAEDVYLLNPRNYQSESSHIYSDEKYTALLKHELCHCFIEIITNRYYRPVWLNEGLAVFLSGQNKFHSKPTSLKTFPFDDFYDKSGPGVYTKAGFIVEFLVKKFSKQKILKLLKQSKQFNSAEKFRKLFKQVYGLNLNPAIFI